MPEPEDIECDEISGASSHACAPLIEVIRHFEGEHFLPPQSERAAFVPREKASRNGFGTGK
jgi:hypothetical protein